MPAGPYGIGADYQFQSGQSTLDPGSMGGLLAFLGGNNWQQQLGDYLKYYQQQYPQGAGAGQPTSYYNPPAQQTPGQAPWTATPPIQEATGLLGGPPTTPGNTAAQQPFTPNVGNPFVTNPDPKESKVPAIPSTVPPPRSAADILRERIAAAQANGTLPGLLGQPPSMPRGAEEPNPTYIPTPFGEGGPPTGGTPTGPLGGGLGGGLPPTTPYTPPATTPATAPPVGGVKSTNERDPNTWIGAQRPNQWTPPEFLQTYGQYGSPFSSMGQQVGQALFNGVQAQPYRQTWEQSVLPPKPSTDRYQSQSKYYPGFQPPPKGQPLAPGMNPNYGLNQPQANRSMFSGYPLNGTVPIWSPMGMGGSVTNQWNPFIGSNQGMPGQQQTGGAYPVQQRPAQQPQQQPMQPQRGYNQAPSMGDPFSPNYNPGVDPGRYAQAPSYGGMTQQQGGISISQLLGLLGPIGATR